MWCVRVCMQMYVDPKKINEQTEQDSQKERKICGYHRERELGGEQNGLKQLIVW